MIKEATASALLLRRSQAGSWLLCLVWHPRLEGWLPTGGHVEPDETPAEAALREVREETGYHARLISGPRVPLPAGFPHPPVVAPWWVVEMPACADNHTSGSHVHVDHLFLALADGGDQPEGGQHQARWLTAAELAHDPGIAEDSRLQAIELLAQMADTLE